MSDVHLPSPQSHAQPPPGPPRSSSTFHFLAGLSTGVFSAALLQPVDLLKTRVQQSRSSSIASTLSSITSGPDALRSLWRGTIPSIIRTGFGSALYFTTLNALRQRITRNSALLPSSLIAVSSTSSRTSSSSLPRLSNLANLTTGGVARASAGFILMPLTVIKVRYESSLYSYRSLWEAITAIVKAEGIRGFFSGVGATAVRDAPYAGVYVLFYEQMKPILGSMVSEKKSTDLRDSRLELAQNMSTPRSAATNFLSGVFAAGAATALTNPFDAVKTRLQLMPRKYVNMAQAVRMMLKEEGTRSLFDGLALRMGRKVLSSALVWTLYEEILRKAERTWVGRMESEKHGV